jgi:hypothetical protein
MEYIQIQSAVLPEGGYIEDSDVREIIDMVANRLQYLRVVQRTRLTQLSEDSRVPRSRLTRIELRKTDCALSDGILISAALGVRFSDILRYAEDEIIPVDKAPWINGRQSPSVRFVLEMEPFEYDHGPRHNYPHEAF